MAMDEDMEVLMEKLWSEGSKLKNGLTWVVKVNVLLLQEKWVCVLT